MLLSWRRSHLFGVLGVFLFSGHFTAAIDLNISSTDSIKKAASTVAYGMMTYYKGNESGMPQGLLPDPYYWWEAGAMFGQMVEYWFYTGDDTYNNVTMQGMLAQVGPDNDFMPPNQTKTEGNDDQAFWAFAAMSAAEMKFPDPPPKQPSWLSLAQATFNLQASRWDTQNCNGGLRWQIFAFNKGYDYKNSISNGGFFQLAARLAKYTDNATYADWADKTWDWMQSTPLFTDDYHIYDGVNIANCSAPSLLQWSYNVGTFLMGAANMYNYTDGSPKWKTRVDKLLTAANLFFPDGDIMVEVACEPQQTCNNDQPSFKAYLARWMAATAQIAPFTQDRIMKKLRASAIGAAQQCSGGTDGKTCGRTWKSATWDGKLGPGEQMSALSVIQANLIQKVAPPVTLQKGGVSKSDPSAGTQGDHPIILDPLLTRKITAGDRAGAVIITAITLVALFPQGNKANTFTTSLQKKRKLSRQDIPEPQLSTRASYVNGSSSPPSQHSQSSPTRHRSLPDSASHLNSSRPPPPSIPQHMVLETARNGRSPTPELTSTAASSPSAAYAGLSLDGEGSGDTSGFDDPKANNTAEKTVIREFKSLNHVSERSCSPVTKRSASDMEETNAQTKGIDLVGDVNQEPGTVPKSTDDSIEPSSLPRRKSQTRHRRESTIDALAYDVPHSGEEISLPLESGSKISSVSRGAYRTPQSGPSSTTSSAGHQEASAGSTASRSPSCDPPTLDDQIEQVVALAHKPMQEGQKGFIISKKWLSRVLSRGSNTKEADKYGKEAREGAIGPVDNTGISLVTDPSVAALYDEAGEIYVPLRPGLQCPDDFEILPQEAWDLIIHWYGLAKGSAVVTRYCHNTSTSETMENLQYEFHPPVFTILKLPETCEETTAKVGKEASAVPIKVLASRHELYQTFLKRIKTLAGIDLKTKVRIWRILGGLGTGVQSGMITPAQSRSNSPTPNYVAPVDPGNRLVIDPNAFVNLQLGSQRELIDAKDETANEKYNGHLTIDIVGLRQDEVIVLEEQIGGPAGGEWPSDAVGSHIKTNGVAISVTRSGSTTVQDSLKPKANISSGRSSPAPGGMMTRGRQQKNGRARGTVGLNNLGNTCYMNSALQCIRSVEELTHYFLLEKHQKDLNPSNPLSHNGMVAKAYAGLLKEMFGANTPYSFAPRSFKNVIGKYGPSFSGYQQQDSQEFLLFLLDGLQEDLSRVHKKPYIEKPDSTDEMVHDPVALRSMADKCWDIYKARSDSVITDLFAGMYKSTVVCPVCDKVSIIFDPFNNLTLQLPIESVWAKEIYYYPLHSRPIRLNVDIDKNASFMALKEYVAKKVDVDPKRTILAEIYKSRFYKMFDDKKSVGEERIAENDKIAVFELESRPSNYPPPKKKMQRYRTTLYWNNSDEEEDIPEGDSPLADNMLVAVFNRQMKESHTRFQQRSIFGVPYYIVLTRDEAKDYDTILRKVLAKVATMTTKGFLRDESELGNDSTPEDSDTVLMNNDDADSSSDLKIQTKSCESEDGMVDISMRDTNDESQTADQNPIFLRGPKSKSLPKMLQPGGFITPEVRNMFEMKYFSSNNEMIPTGWSTLQDENKEYPTIASRCLNREVERRSTKGKLARRLNRLDSASSSEADVEDIEIPIPTPALQPDYDSDSSGLPEVEQITQPPINYSFSAFSNESRRNSKGIITYSKKGKNAAINGHHEEMEPDIDNPSLIRLGEAIVLDWNSDAHDSLFTARESDHDEMRGSATWDAVPLMPDLELAQKRELRKSRKRNGISLDDCLDEFGKAEILSENDAWYCPRCKEHQRASKTFELWKAPDILVIHLKRFSAQGRNLRDKLDVLVDFPVEGLDLSSRVAMLEDGKSPIYDLFAVDNHYGGLGGGHYTAFAQNFTDRNWYEYNDSSVSRRTNSQVVVTAAAYLLFYRRRADHPLGGPFFQKLMKNSDAGSESQSDSRNESPAGEGKRLDDSSLNGLSSAFTEAGATHQLGGGGLATVGTARRTGVDDDLPSYSENNEDQPAHSTLESMEIDEDEGIGGIGNLGGGSPSWSFDRISSREMQRSTHQIIAPPGSDVEEEDLFSDESNKAVSPSSDDGGRLNDFRDDEGTTSGVFGPHRSGSTPVQDAPPPLEDYDDMAVAEVRLGEGEDMLKLD